MPGKELHIFDFDGTLFRSPEPNPKLWTNTMLGKIKATTDQQGLGWFQELITLQAPYVHENPDESWFNPPILEKCKSTLADPNCITVLLTGRQIIYDERIKHILGGMNLNFHHYGLKPGGFIFTMDFKLNFISDLREKYRDDLAKIVIYEDRIEHVGKFENYLKRLQLDYEVVHVIPNNICLDREMEIELVKKLISRNAPSSLLVPVPTYTGLILDKTSRDNLLSWIPPPPQWVVTAHHMTMALGNQPIPGEVKLGDKGELVITHVGFDTRSLAVKVAGMPSTNPIPHVTIAHAPNAKPADSNEIQEWISVEDLVKNGGILKQTLYVPTFKTKSVEVSEESTTGTVTTTTTVQETIIQPPNSDIPLLTLQTILPPNAQLSGTVHIENMFNIVDPARVRPPRETTKDPFPKGVSIGEIIKRRHPNVQGKVIGEVVRRVRTWAQDKEEISVEELEDFVKNIDLNSLQ